MVPLPAEEGLTVDDGNRTAFKAADTRFLGGSIRVAAVTDGMAAAAAAAAAIL